MTDDDRAPDAAAEPHWVRVARLIAEPPGTAAGGPRPVKVHDSRSAVEVLADLLRAEPPDAPSSTDTEHALALVRARRDAGDLVPADDAGPRPMRGRGIAWVAGMLAAAVVLAMVGLDWRRHTVPDRADQARAVTVSGGLALATGIGRVDSLRLPDGTRVVLGPGSRIDTADGYARRTRAVTLRGEGYFDVVHDDARPFVVRTGQALLRDVGTRFTVSTGPSTGTVVSVQGGIVALQDRRRGATDRIRMVA